LADADPQYLPYYFASKPQLPLQWSHFLPTQPAPEVYRVPPGVQGPRWAWEDDDDTGAHWCPLKVRVDHSPDYDTTSGPYKEGPSYYGVYERQGAINGKYSYKNANGDRAIWYEGGSWRVGHFKNLGTSTCGFYTTEDTPCPNPKPVSLRPWTWRYFIQAAGIWVDADRGMSIWEHVEWDIWDDFNPDN